MYSVLDDFIAKNGISCPKNRFSKFDIFVRYVMQNPSQFNGWDSYLDCGRYVVFVDVPSRTIGIQIFDQNCNLGNCDGVRNCGVSADDVGKAETKKSNSA